jgi:hypothetical protein
LAQRAARFRAVFVHESGVFGAFTLFGPSSTFLSVIVVGAQFFDNWATIGSTGTGITAGSHTVGDHPFAVLGAFAIFGPLGAAGACVGFAGGGLFVGRAGGLFDLVGFTVAERAASSTAVGDHPVRVFSALVIFGPDSAEGVGGFALGFVSRAVGQSGSFLGFSSQFFGGFFGGGGVCGFFVGFEDASTHLITISISVVAVESVHDIFQEFSAVSTGSIILAGTASITVSNSFSKSITGQGRALGGNFKFQRGGGIDTVDDSRGKTSASGIAEESEGSKFVHYSQ